jgi:hypothetical protein
VSWREPKAEDAAKSLGMSFLYKFGYDYASRFLHPSATDGRHEFEFLTGLGSRGDRGDQRIILHDSALAFTILLSEALNSGSLEWRSIIFDCVDAFRKALTGEALEYRQCFEKIASAGREVEWARPKPTTAPQPTQDARRGCRHIFLSWLPWK